jgi:hypothetical protein
MGLWHSKERVKITVSGDVAEWLRLQGARDRTTKSETIETALRELWSARQSAGLAVVSQAPECVRIDGHDARLLKCRDCEDATWG